MISKTFKRLFLKKQFKLMNLISRSNYTHPQHRNFFKAKWSEVIKRLQFNNFFFGGKILSESRENHCVGQTNIPFSRHEKSKFFPLQGFVTSFSHNEQNKLNSITRPYKASYSRERMSLEAFLSFDQTILKYFTGKKWNLVLIYHHIKGLLLKKLRC